MINSLIEGIISRRSRFLTASRLIAHWGCGITLGAVSSIESIPITIGLGILFMVVGQLGVHFLWVKKDG